MSTLNVVDEGFYIQ